MPAVRPGVVEEAVIESISCLRCRHCRLEPDTDMTRTQTMIHCGKMAARRVINLEGCLMTEAADKTRFCTPVEHAYIRTNYRVAPMAMLTRHTGRDAGTLKNKAAALGTGPRVKSEDATKAGLKKARLVREARGEFVTAAQHEYIVRRHTRGDWPRTGGDNAPATLAAREALRKEIVEAVAKLGPHWSWHSISRHAIHSTPGYQRDLQRRRKEYRCRLERARLQTYAKALQERAASHTPLLRHQPPASAPPTP